MLRILKTLYLIVAIKQGGIAEVVISGVIETIGGIINYSLLFIALLLEKGANVKAKDNHGRTALMWADKKGHKAVAGLLVGRRADIGPRSEDGEEF